jgi:NAD+ synthase (glutamine-hydrolysing)
MTPFLSIYTHGFIRAAVCVPFVRVADPAYNCERIIGLAWRASDQHAAIALFPELGISAYSNDDLFQQGALLAATRRGFTARGRGQSRPHANADRRRAPGL